MPHPYELLSDEDRYALTLGQFVTGFNKLEERLTYIALTLYRWGTGADFAKTKGAPRALGAKLEMIQRCFETDPNLVDLSKVGLALVTAADLLATERNLIVHGAVFQPFADLPPVLGRLDLLLMDGGPIEFRNVPTLETLLDLQRSLLMTLEPALHLSESLIRLIPQDHLDKAHREISG